MDHASTRRSALVAAVLAAGVVGTAQAQQGPVVARAATQPARTDSDWESRFTTYFWLPRTDGSATVRGNSIDMSTDYGDALDGLHSTIGTAFHFESEAGNFSFLTDLTWVKFEDEKSGTAPKTEAEFTNGIYEFAGAFKLFDNRTPRGTKNELRVDGIAGIRWNDLKSELEVPPLGLTASSRRNWADFFVGARARWQLTDKLQIYGRGDIGAGESDAIWGALVGMDWRFERQIALQAGYRWYSVDYDAGSGKHEFAYDFLIQGPFLGITFIF
jgi:hypothetical protein